MSRCLYLKKDGKQCVRSAKSDFSFCWQHQNYTTAIKSQKGGQDGSDTKQKKLTNEKQNGEKQKNDLKLAIQEGNLDDVKKLIEAGADTSFDNDYALRYASHEGRSDIVEELLKHRDVESVHSGDIIALQWAVDQNHLDVIKTLFKLKYLNPTEIDLSDVTNQDIINYIKNKTTDWILIRKFLSDQIVEIMDNVENEEANEEAKIRLLLDKGADPNTQTRGGLSILMWASYVEYPELVRFLLNKGAKIDTQERDMGETALMMASENGNAEIVKLLLDKGANPDIQNHHDMTALFIASQNGHLEIVKLLVEKGAKIDILNIDTFSHEIMKFLLEKADIHDLDKMIAHYEGQIYDMEHFEFGEEDDSGYEGPDESEIYKSKKFLNELKFAKEKRQKTEKQKK